MPDEPNAIAAFYAARAAEEDMDAFGEAWRVESEPLGVTAVLFVAVGTPDAERLVREKLERMFSRRIDIGIAHDRDHPEDSVTWLRDLRMGYTKFVMPPSFPTWTVWEKLGWITASHTFDAP